MSNITHSGDKHAAIAADFAVIHNQVVAWGDMDAFGHVNNVDYYRYIENARLAYYEALGLKLDDVITVILSSQCRYIKAVVYPDTLYIGAKTVKLGTSSFVMNYSLYSTAQQDLVATGEAVIVTLDAQQQKIAIPQALREKIIALESKVANHLS
ncbi:MULTISPECIES: acyl-CoA thioesterase [unclassified Acinetobacter]|uniref:acyl-CoA thioesterase n=1 Tax=unclassified Acinetobacter TaxID=196816 RepID=UPI0035BAD683